MVSNTFLNLKEEKKNRIINSAKKEFSRVPLEKALVSNIIRDSNIPRGSFYQYFENIEDLFVYIIDDIYEKSLSRIVIDEENNYFDHLKNYFYKILNVFDNGENRQFNINIYMSFINDNLSNSKLICDMNELWIKEDSQSIPQDIKDLKNSKIFLGLIEMANITCLNEFVMKGKRKDDVFEEYENYLNYIRKAIVKTNKLG